MRLILSSLTLLTAALSWAHGEQRPNIIFLLADDLATISLGCYGNDEVHTPHIDSLAANGIAFDRHYNTTAICMASRANIMTGLYEYRTGCNFEYGDLSAELWAQSYPLLLREAGYLTAFAGKFGFEITGHGIGENDFDMYGGGPGQTSFKTAQNKHMAKYAKDFPHATRSYGAFGQDVIKAAKQNNQPFSLSISFKAPHRPVEPDPEFDHIYAGKTFTKPANYGRDFGAHMAEQSKMGRQYGRFSSWGYDKNYDKVMAQYYQQIYGIDVAVGMILEELETQDLAKNTVIIFTSDNGFMCGSHGYGSKVLPIEESSRVPLIMYDPRHHRPGQARRSRALTGNIDFLATILELAGVSVPTGIDGVSLAPLMTNPEGDVRDSLTLMNNWGPVATHFMSTVTKDWKYTYWFYAADELEPTEELFHLAEDPLESTNLARNPEHKSTIEALRQTYDEQLAHWKQHAIGNHQRQALLFDRHRDWETKVPELPKAGGKKAGKKKK